MEKSQAYIIATAIVVAGLIVAATVLSTPRPGRYEYVTIGSVFRVFDSRTGTIWSIHREPQHLGDTQDTKDTWWLRVPPPAEGVRWRRASR